MKKILFALLILSACTKQVPTAQSPVYNITIQDSSQTIIGNDNIAESKPDVSVDQVAEPETVSTAESTSSNAIYYIIILFLLICCAVEAIMWLKEKNQ